MTPKDYSPDNESPRDAVANVIQELRDHAAMTVFRVTGTDVIRWERRLMGALRKLDAEKSLEWPGALVQAVEDQQGEIEKLKQRDEGWMAIMADELAATKELWDALGLSVEDFERAGKSSQECVLNRIRESLGDWANLLQPLAFRAKRLRNDPGNRFDEWGDGAPLGAPLTAKEVRAVETVFDALAKIAPSTSRETSSRNPSSGAALSGLDRETPQMSLRELNKYERAMKAETRAEQIARWEAEGRLVPGCGGCQEFYDYPGLPAEKMAPGHIASVGCESGKRPHCTCDVCW